MTLTEARRILERYNAWRRYDGPLEQTPTQPEPKEIGEAIDLAISVLPEDRPRKTASQRLAEIRQGIRETFNGFDPFAKRSRVREDMIWRQAVFYQLRNEGYTFPEVAKASGYSHSTVLFGCTQTRDGLDIKDYETKVVWRRLNEITNGNTDNQLQDPDSDGSRGAECS